MFLFPLIPTDGLFDTRVGHVGTVILKRCGVEGNAGGLITLVIFV